MKKLQAVDVFQEKQKMFSKSNFQFRKKMIGLANTRKLVQLFSAMKYNKPNELICQPNK